MRIANFKQFIISFAIFLFASFPVFAHEYWLEPRLYEIAPGDLLEADLRNGQHYKGNQLYFLKQFFTRFEIFNGEKTHKATGSNGDQPALKFTTTKPGLHIITYQSTYDTLTFKKWEKFVTYAKTQSLDGVVARHLERGLPQKFFKEDYARTIKALVRVGEGKGQDKHTGLPYEFVAQDNPYTMGANPDDDDVFLTVRLFLDEKFAPDKQVLIFQNNGKISQSVTRTDAQGFAKIPLKGGGKFMLSSVHMFEGDDDSNTKLPEWLSYWANLTFALPGADALLKKAAE